MAFPLQGQPRAESALFDCLTPLHPLRNPPGHAMSMAFANDRPRGQGLPLSFRALGSGLALYALVAGLVTFLGWATGWQRLTDWPGSGISMKPNAALVAMAGGTALLHLHQGWPATWLVRALGAFLSLIGGLTLLQHLTGLNFGIDTLLWNESEGARATAAPGRMGPPGSSAALLCGT